MVGKSVCKKKTVDYCESWTHKTSWKLGQKDLTWTQVNEKIKHIMLVRDG